MFTTFSARHNNGELPPNETILQRLEQTGAVIFRDYQFSLQRFDEFSNGFGSKVVFHGGRRIGINAEDSIQDVTEGCDEVPGHVEMGRRPDQPDFAWFYCMRPAPTGGETTLIDGIAVTKALRPETAKMFSETDLCFEGLVTRESWRRSFKVDSVAELKQLIQREYEADNIRFEFREDDSFVGTYTTSAFKEHRLGRCFANSIFGPYKGDSGGSVRLASGSLIPTDVLAELETVYLKCQVTIPLCTGDAVFIDNKRVMHGRTRFTDDGSRKIFAKFMNAGPRS